MLEKGPAKKVVLWVNEETKHPHHREKLWLAVFEYLRHKRVAGASVMHTQMGFGDRHKVHRGDSPKRRRLLTESSSSKPQSVWRKCCRRSTKWW